MLGHVGLFLLPGSTHGQLCVICDSSYRWISSWHGMKVEFLWGQFVSFFSCKIVSADFIRLKCFLYQVWTQLKHKLEFVHPNTQIKGLYCHEIAFKKAKNDLYNDMSVLAFRRRWLVYFEGGGQCIKHASLTEIRSRATITYSDL